MMLGCTSLTNAMVYIGSHSVLAWIGPEGSDTELAVSWIKRVAQLTNGFGDSVFRNEDHEERKETETVEEISFERSEELGVSFRNEEAWKAFSSFYDRPWFQRLWIVGPYRRFVSHKTSVVRINSYSGASREACW